MSTAARTDTIAWGFRARFRRSAFGWKGTQLAIGRINEALTEIRAVARLLRSIPAARRDLLSGDRDTNGRLFRPTQPTRAPGGCIRLH